MIEDRFLDMDPVVRKHETKLNLNCAWKKVGKKISDRRLPVDPWVKYAKIALEECINKNFYISIMWTADIQTFYNEVAKYKKSGYR